jgi:hypothetical protein
VALEVEDNFEILTGAGDGDRRALAIAQFELHDAHLAGAGAIGVQAQILRTDRPRRRVSLDRVGLIAIKHDPSFFEQNSAGAKRLDRRGVVAHEKHRSTGPRNFADLAQTLLLKRSVADRQYFIDRENLGLELRGDRKRQPDPHADRVSFDGRVDEFADPCKIDNLLKFPGDLAARHPEDHAVEKDIVAPGQFRVKSGADFEKRGDPAA